MRKLKLSYFAALLILAITWSCSDDDTSISIPKDNTVTVKNTFENAANPEVSFASFLDFAFTGSDVEFPEMLKADFTANGGILVNPLYAINLTENSIEYTLLPVEGDPFWSSNYRELEAGVKDRYYFTFTGTHNVASFTASDPAINLRIDANNVFVVEVGEGFDFKPGASFTITLDANDTSKPAIAQNDEITVRNTFENATNPEVSFALFLDNVFGSSLGIDGLDVMNTVKVSPVALGEDGLNLTSNVSYNSVEFPETLKKDLTANGALLINGLYSIDITENTIEYTLLPVEGDPFWSANYRVLEAGVKDRYYFTFEKPHGVTSFTSSDPAINLRIDSDNILVVEVGEGFDFKPGASFVLTLN